jgi:serine protease Do
MTLPPGMEHPQMPEDGVASATGSGFIVSTDGYILSNHHVVEGATRVRVRLLDGRRFDATVVGSDASTDVAVLKIDATGLTPSALGVSDNVRVGEWVLAIGNPLGSELTFSVTQGIVSAKGRGISANPNRRRDADITDFIQTDAAINQGNSGGPLLNVRGEVIGIVSMIASTTGYFAGYAFAVPIDLARAVMNQIIERGRVERTQLGILVANATAEDADYLGLESIDGVRVQNFSDDDSPAKRAGLEPGDVIIAVDGTPVRYVAQLQQLVGFRRAGEEVRLEIARKSGRRELVARVKALPSAADQADPEPPTALAPTAPPATNRLGVTVEPVTSSLVQQYRLPAGTRGLLVRSVPSTAPAVEHLAGSDVMSHPDVITAVEGKPVRTEAELRAALNEARNGVVTLTVHSEHPEIRGSRIVRVRLLPE